MKATYVGTEDKCFTINFCELFMFSVFLTEVSFVLKKFTDKSPERFILEGRRFKSKGCLPQWQSIENRTKESFPIILFIHVY
jgi:hypothetical protein